MDLNYIEIPRINNEDVFEDFVLDIWQSKKGFSQVQRNGRKGQGQDGIDIYGIRPDLKWFGVQCKVRQEDILLSDVQNDIISAKEFSPPITEYIIFTTARRDAKIQKEIRNLNEQTEQFSIDITFWEDIEKQLKTNDYIHIYKKYYRQFFHHRLNVDLSPFHELINNISARKPPFPNFDDFLFGYVAETEKFNTVVQTIERDGSSLIWGNGGTGKTVLAANIAVSHFKEGYFPLYIDFSEHTGRDIIQHIIAYLDLYIGNDSIIIFDNCHFAQDLPKFYPKIRKLQNSTNFRALFISRVGPDNESQNPDFLSFSQLYKNEGGESLKLTVDDEEFRSIIKFNTRKGKEIHWDETRSLKPLCNKFGRDLFIFAFTLFHTPNPIDLHSLTPLTNRINNPIDQKYLNRFGNNPSKLNAFLNVSALSAIGLPAYKSDMCQKTPYENELKEEISDGILNQTSDGILSHAHPSLASMIIKRHAQVTNKKTINIIADAIVNCKQIPHNSLNLLTNQHYFRYEYILKNLFRDLSKSKKLLRLGIILPSRWWEIVSSSFKRTYLKLLFSNLTLTIKALPVDDLTTTSNLLTQIKNKDQIITQLHKRIDLLWSVVSQTSPHIVSKFLSQLHDLTKSKDIEYPNRKIANEMLVNLVERIGDNESIYFAIITRSSISLGYVTSLLLFLKQHYPGIHDIIAEDLFLPSYRKRLVRRGLNKQLDHFTKFIEYSEKQVNVTRETFLSELSSSPNINLINYAFQRCTLDSIAYYLRFWENCTCKECKNYHVKLTSNLFSPKQKPFIIECIKNSGIQQITTFLKYGLSVGKDLSSLLLPDICSDSIISSIQINSKAILPNQANSVLQRLAEVGNVGKSLSAKLKPRLIGSDKQLLNSILCNVDVRDSVSFLKKLHNEGDEKKEIFILTKLKENKYFEKWLKREIENNIKSYFKTKNTKRIQTGFITKFTFVLKYLILSDKDIFNNLIVNCKGRIDDLIKILTKEHIDMVSLFLCTLKDFEEHSNVLLEKIIDKLIIETNVKKLCLNEFVKDVSYLKSFLDYTKKHSKDLHDAVVGQIETRYINEFFDACARSTPHQLVSLLQFADKNYRSEVINSCSIINSLTGNRLKIFKQKFNKVPASYKISLVRYLNKNEMELDLEFKDFEENL